MPAASVSDDPEVRAASVCPDITQVDTRCLDQLYGFPGNGSSGWPRLESLFLGSLCVCVLQLLAAQLCGALRQPGQQHWTVQCRVVSAPSLSASPLQITTTGMFLDVAWRQHMNWKGVGLYLEASMEFHREKHLVPFLWAGSNVRRQNVAQWVNLQLSPRPPPPSPCLNFCLHAQIHNYFRTRRPGSLLTLSPGRGIVSLTPRVLCLHPFAQHALPSAPPVEFSITSHVRGTLRSVPPWRLQQELLRRRPSTLPTPVFQVLFLHRSARGGVESTRPFASFRGNYGVRRAARGFCERRSTQQLSVQPAVRPLKLGRPRIRAYLYPVNVQPQTAAPPLERTRSHDLSPFYSTVYLGSCRGSTSLKYVGSERKRDATSLHKDPDRSSRNPAAADFPEEMKLPLNKGYSFLEKKKSPR